MKTVPNRLWLILIFVFMTSFVFAKIPSTTKQLIVAVSNSWSSPNAKLYLYEKVKGKWKRVDGPIKSVIGKRGSGRGLGKVNLSKGPNKKEGDKKAPAGVFEIPFIFGSGADHYKYPYKKMTKNSICVDDSNSKYYNQIVDKQKVDKDYHSFENMLLKSGLYSKGLFIAHNSKSIKGRGSCIFLHIRKSGWRATAGCTTVERRVVEKIMKWLDPQKKPMFVLAPKSEISKLLPKGILIK